MDRRSWKGIELFFDMNKEWCLPKRLQRLFFNKSTYKWYHCHTFFNPSRFFVFFTGIIVWDPTEGRRPQDGVPVAAGQPACHAELPSASRGGARPHLSGREGAEPNSGICHGLHPPHQHADQSTRTGTQLHWLVLCWRSQCGLGLLKWSNLGFYI